MSQEPKSVDQLTAELDKRRASLAADVEALAQRLSPASVKDSLLGGFKAKAQSKASSLSDSVSALKSRHGDDDDSEEGDHSPSILSAAKRAAAQASQDAAAVSFGVAGVAPSEVDGANGAFDPHDPWAPSPQAQHKHAEAAAQSQSSLPDKLTALLPGCVSGDDECPIRQTVADLQQHATRLINDARDGDPHSLGIVTAAALALAGISVGAVVKAIRS